MRHLNKVPIPIEDKRLVDQPRTHSCIVPEYRVPATDKILGTSISRPPAYQPRWWLDTGCRQSRVFYYVPISIVLVVIPLANRMRSGKGGIHPQVILSAIDVVRFT
jgi:hypothetical protein